MPQSNRAHNLRCVVCGMMVREDRYRAGPYPPETREQEFGGSYKTAVGRRRHIGRMEWSSPVPYTREELVQMRQWLTAAIAKLDEEGG